MKPEDEITGIKKSAMLLIALGPDAASKILSHLDEATVFKLVQEISKVPDLTIEDKEEIIGEFILEIKKNKNSVFGGENVAKNILKVAFGEDKADEILSNLAHMDIEKEFTFLQTIDPETLASLLENEHPQTITATLFYLTPAQTANILKILPTYLSKEIIKRMAKLDKPSPKALAETVRVLKIKYEKLKQSGNKAEKTDGINTLIDIMNQMNPSQEKKLMDYFEIKVPEISERISERLFNFENILYLTNKEIQVLIDEVNDDYLFAQALKGAGDDLRFKLFRNMSQNRATDILNEMDEMGAVRLTKIEEARDTIVRTMRMLNDNGYLTIRKENEKYVE
ncbi:MAG: flagellar motor switch protein FliG [Spirochaetes bacterium]|nr:flagellar motor switch protein FliG [Spirochaetota bacterium]